MTTSNSENSVYVWLWLPNATKPVVAGKLEYINHQYHFFYGQSYLQNKKAISLFPDTLPLIGGKRFPSDHDIHGVFRDALPDAWGQRVLHYRYPEKNLTPIEMLLLSSSDRIGAFDFQSSATQYESPIEKPIALSTLMVAVEKFDANLPIPEKLNLALMHGTSVGGARPKALLEDANKHFLAKFSSSTDVFPIVQAEYVAMWLAKKAKLNVAQVLLTKIKNKSILLVERFDRVVKKEATTKRLMVSGLTQLGLNEWEGRYASYLDLADVIIKKNKMPIKDCIELFRRMVFNILIGNTDDHAKNHAFFWDGEQYSLTPAYDICPYIRAGQQASQAMQIGEQGADSTIKNALSCCARFGLSKEEAKKEVEQLESVIQHYWNEACEQAELTSNQQKQLRHSAVLNPYIFT